MNGESFANVWEETVVIPTYRAGEPEKSPLFIEKRAYQGSTGKVYPLQVTETIEDEKTDVAYRAVFLENEYLKVMVLPELGGRIQRAYDKTNGYDFVYYNHVIRPALVGLAGPWISGGIEFNWPQHHRPSTFAPVDYTLEKKADGSCTVCLSETDKMYGTKGLAEISLYPGKAYIEIRGQLYNGTDLPQTFLWWANPAVPVNEHTYSVFPPDVNAVMDHGRRAVSTFPIATGEYYKCDYSAGVDISRYKNVPVPTSYMAAHSDYDFIGNYDESVQAGLLHVADHHISPGKKQWTWGNGDFGRMWDRNLTESDGPYIELMTGVFTDNQPDFTYLAPRETKEFVQYFMPYKGVGRVCNATKEAAVSLERAIEDSEERNTPIPRMTVKVYTTGVYPAAEILIFRCGEPWQRLQADLSPEQCFAASFDAPGEDTDYSVQVFDSYKVLLVSASVYKKEPEPIPQPAEVMKKPEEMKSLEELYLAATHLEQYRHATREPADYYLEGLKRDATDIRLNNGYGRLLYKRGKVRESIPYFEAAVKKQTWKNPNPYSGECYFNLGLALVTASQMEELCEDAPSLKTLRVDGAVEKAYDAFYKSTWCADTQGAGFYWLGCLASRKGNYQEALGFFEQSMIRNWHDMNARMLKAAMLRILGNVSSRLSADGISSEGQDASSLKTLRVEGAPASVDSVLEAFLKESLAIDPLHMGCLYEMALLVEERHGVEDGFGKSDWQQKMRTEPHNYLELSLPYIKAGLYEEALDILEACPEPNPMCLYYQGYVHGLRAAAMEKWCEDGAVVTPLPFGQRQGAPSLETLRVDDAVDTERAKALICLRQAEEMNPDGCFPNRIEEIGILEYVIKTLCVGGAMETPPPSGRRISRPKDEDATRRGQDAPPLETLCVGGAMAHYYLGNLFYDKKQYDDAVRHWEITTQRKPEFAMAHRNLAIAYYNHGQNTPSMKKNALRLDGAMEEMARACALDPGYPRMWLEYDQLASRANLSVSERLATLGAHMDLVQKRDDLYLRYITLLNCDGRYQEALDAILSRQFHPWEGGEGKVSTQYRYARIHLAIQCLEEGKPEQALKHLEASLAYPVSLGEGKLPNVPDNQAYYYMGLAYRMIAESNNRIGEVNDCSAGRESGAIVLEEKTAEEKSVYYLELAAAGPQEPEPVLYYNDQPSDYIFYQGLANRAMGREAAAKKAFHRMIAFGEAHLFDQVEYDFFAVSLPEIEVFQEDIGKRNRLYCNYLRALGSLGLGEQAKAQELLDMILGEQADYQGAIQARDARHLRRQMNWVC